MRSGKSLVGKQIISLEDGSRIGTVRDLYLDSGLSSVVAIFLGRESLISRKAKFIRRRDIQVLGKDAILVSGVNAIIHRNRGKDYPKWVRRDHLQGRPINTQEVPGTPGLSIAVMSFPSTGRISSPGAPGTATGT